MDEDTEQIKEIQHLQIFNTPELIEKKSYSPPWSAYFDTPILSGRTRSKNKPLEEETSAGAGGVSTPPTGETQVPSSVAHNTASSTITVTGQSVGHSKHSGDLGVPAVSDAGTGGKRSTRSVRTKGKFCSNVVV